MEKQFLDVLYRRRWEIQTDLEMAEEIHTFPDDGCSAQVHTKGIRDLKAMLALQDQNITDYLTFHR